MCNQYYPIEKRKPKYKNKLILRYLHPHHDPKKLIKSHNLILMNVITNTKTKKTSQKEICETYKQYK